MGQGWAPPMGPWMPVMPDISSLSRLLFNCGVQGTDSAHSQTPTKGWSKEVIRARRWCPRTHRLTDQVPLAHSEAPGYLVYPLQIWALSSALGLWEGVAPAGLPQSKGWALVLGLPSEERRRLKSLHLIHKEGPEWGHKGGQPMERQQRGGKGEKVKSIPLSCSTPAPAPPPPSQPL